ncbi:MAG: hypothetical protein IJ242_11580 [Clostridia bacterium]|nr:hypothetical protein [Clostridia bacterium]
MNQTIQALLNNQEDNHVLPFFWQHGEDETTLREMMGAIHGAGCRAVCVESRPHPDFCGPKWWHDMDIILEEARSRDMKVWILDDSHFPTGFANGALKDRPDSLCRQSIFLNTMSLPSASGTMCVDLAAEGMLKPPAKKPANMMEERFFSIPPARVFDDDRVVRISLRQADQEKDLTGSLSGYTLTFDKSAGDAELRILVASRNAGYHRDYINMTDRESVRVLIDAVYEPHWQHYAKDFGHTIAGFFSDEPELGNGFMYDKNNPLGIRQDLPWGRELEEAVSKALGNGWEKQLERLWESNVSPETARVHMAYMDCLTRLLRQNFSEQIGQWCRTHGVMYIGHVIEDDGHHCRTGSSLGHYFRSLEGQDMAGIDDIGGQVYPCGEDEPTIQFQGFPRDGTFYHYGLACLARSAAALEPRKAGRAMCEIFGNYGWEEGVRLEKYLADHFLVRGINYFVPHAFTGSAFPDPDCPPHFYAHGHNPQYRHFGRLMQYINRVATLTSSGRHQVPAAILYHGESEWCDRNAMPFEQPGRRLYDNQIDYHVIPADFLADTGRCLISSDRTFSVNGQTYRVLIVPGCACLCTSAAENLNRLAEANVPVFFAEQKPAFVSETGASLPPSLSACPIVPLEKLAEEVRKLGIPLPVLSPESQRIRILDIAGDTPLAMIVNEDAVPWTGTVSLPWTGRPCFLYDAFENRCLSAEQTPDGIQITVEPLKPLFLVSGTSAAPLHYSPTPLHEIPLTGWTRSICEGAAYPQFSIPEDTVVPDGMQLAKEKPDFSGFVRYECSFLLPESGSILLEIDDAAEAVEVFLNSESAGIQISPPFRYDLMGHTGKNTLRIEVATTLERECYPMLEGHRKLLAKTPACGSGITGSVRLHTATGIPR